MDVEVAGNDEFMRGGGCMGKKRSELVMKGRKRLRVWWWWGWSIDVKQCELSFGKF